MIIKVKDGNKYVKNYIKRTYLTCLDNLCLIMNYIEHQLKHIIIASFVLPKLSSSNVWSESAWNKSRFCQHIAKNIDMYNNFCLLVYLGTKIHKKGSRKSCEIATCLMKNNLSICVATRPLLKMWHTSCTVIHVEDKLGVSLLPHVCF